MTNDALIAMSAASRGFKVFTKNGKDFARLAEFRPFDWEEV
jgi:predicted nucleic acid-binding protein